MNTKTHILTFYNITNFDLDRFDYGCAVVYVYIDVSSDNVTQMTYLGSGIISYIGSNASSARQEPPL